MRICAIALLLISGTADAASITLPLDEISSAATMVLTCESAEQSLSLPIPDRWSVTRVTADIHYTASMALDSDDSQFVFLVNGSPFALTRLESSTPDVRVKLNIPPEYLQAGYNQLSFRVVQMTKTKGCESPCSPDKFTYVNLADSYLDIEYEPKPVPLALSSIAGYLFDPKIIPEARVNLILEDQSAETLTEAGIVASGIARRHDYRKVLFSVTAEPQPGQDNVVVGREAFVRSLLDGAGLSLGDSSGGYLKIFPLPLADGGADPTHALLVITGKEHDHVKLAAETFANISVGFPGSQEMNAFAIQVPDIPAYAGREVLEAGKTYDFKTLNLPTATFQGINPSGREISFRLPADFMIQQNLTAKLLLNFAYGAGARADSALNIVVNDITVRAIRLGDQDGGAFSRYQVDIPTFLFKPGRNVISLGIELHPAAESCPLLTGNLFLTMFETSTLTFPNMPHFVEMPKMELFMLNGFPFTRWPDGYESVVFLPDPSPYSISAAFNLIGMMTQKNGFPLLSLRVTTKPPTGWQGDVLVLGRPALLPKEMQAKSPLVADGKSSVSYPIVRDWAGSYSFAHSTQTGILGPNQALLLQFESPYLAGRSVMLVAAEEPRDIYALTEALLEPQVQGQIMGGIALVDMGPQYDEPLVTSLRAEHTYTTGKGNEVSALESFLYTHPLAYYALLVLLASALAWALYAALLRYRMSRKLGRDASKAGKSG